MTNLVDKGLARNLAYENSQVLIFLFKWGLGQAGDSKFCEHISNKMLLVATKCHGYSFYSFWVINGKPTVA